MRVIISAAGTGGHINPGLAIANKIKEKEPESEIIFIGTNHNAYGFQKDISFTNLKHIIQTLKSRKDAKKIIDEFKPDIVIRNRGVYMLSCFFCCSF